jgi:aromatic ring hydroxylase
MIGEMVANVDLAELMLYGAARASWDAWERGLKEEAGTLTEAEANAPRPPAQFINMQRFFMAQAFSKINEYLRLLGSSGLVMTPTEADFANPGEIDELATYMRGAGMPANRRVATMKLAWDAFATEFGSRQETYEWFFAAHPIDNRVNMYKMKLRQDCEAYAQEFLDSIWEEQEQALQREALSTGG